MTTEAKTLKKLQTPLIALWNNPHKRFLVSFLLLYLFFYYFNILYIGVTAPGGIYISFLDEHLNYVRGLRTFLIETSAAILRRFGYELYTTPIRLYVDGHGGIILVYSCLGYGIMSVFAAFVLSWPEKPLKNKLLFLISGLILIQTLNIGRLISLALLGNKVTFHKTIDHHTLFNLIVYGVLILLAYLWVNASRRKDTSQTFKEKDQHVS